MDWDDGPLYFVGAGNNAGAVTFELGVDEDEEQLTGRLFEVSNGAVLGFSNLTIRDGTGVGDGGAIRAVNANVEFYGAQLLNNTSTSDGGAVAVTAGTLVIEDTLVQGNVSGDDGGAVLVSSGELIINGATFRNNRGTRGGAVYLEFRRRQPLMGPPLIQQRL